MNPDEYTIAEHFIEVGDGHTLYVQEWGNPDAKTPIIFLHGGPGAYTKDRHRQRYDPTKQRIVFFDQRGCGRSIPTGELKNNTTDKLVEDIEAICNKLNLDKVILAGGSWGSALALAYALKYPDRVESMVIQGVYTASRAENQYVDDGFWQTHFPDVWDKVLSDTPKTHHKNPIKYHMERALNPDPTVARSSAYIYANMEAALLSLDDRFSPEPIEDFDPNSIKIEIHYLLNDCFLPERYILDNAHTLAMPIWIVQGRYDFVCPPMTAYTLHKELLNSHLVWTTAGHSNDRANYDATRNILLALTS